MHNIKQKQLHRVYYDHYLTDSCGSDRIQTSTSGGNVKPRVTAADSNDSMVMMGKSLMLLIIE